MNLSLTKLVQKHTEKKKYLPLVFSVRQDLGLFVLQMISGTQSRDDKLQFTPIKRLSS